MSERDEHRIRTRKRQGLVWLASYPGWDPLLDTLSETAELHGPAAWRVTFLGEKTGRLDFASTGGNTVSGALEACAALMSSRACHRCGAPGQARGYGLMIGEGAPIPTRLATRCARCHGNEERGGAAREGPSADRMRMRERQGLRRMANYPGWAHLLDVFSESAEHHAPAEWKATHVDQKMGHLRIASAGGNDVTGALEAFATGMSAHTCFECGAPGHTRGYWPMPSAEGTTPSRIETRCDRCHAAEMGRCGP